MRAKYLPRMVDPTATGIQADPAPAKAQAIRCYEKAGFRQVSLITTPDGDALLMVIDRPSYSIPGRSFLIVLADREFMEPDPTLEFISSLFFVGAVLSRTPRSCQLEH